MRPLYTILLFSIAALVGAIYFATGSKQYVRSADTLFVVCTTSMLCDTVKHIAGDYAHVKGLMGPGGDPHLYRSTESAVYALSSDDVSLCILVAHEIKKRLIKYYPAHAKEYEENATEYIAQLRELDAYVHAQAKKVSVKTIVTAHDAFAYFGKAYGFHVIGLQGISTDAQVSTKDIKVITQKILDQKIPAIFLESSIPSRTIQAVQQAVESHGRHLAIAPELFSDALGDSHTTAGTYHGMIKHNINTIVDSLTS